VSLFGGWELHHCSDRAACVCQPTPPVVHAHACMAIHVHGLVWQSLHKHAIITCYLGSTLCAILVGLHSVGVTDLLGSCCYLGFRCADLRMPVLHGAGQDPCL
jgi:hypothetical protein